MSSRRLLILIATLEADPDSCLARERRDGDWSEREYITAAGVNEIRLLRADSAAMHASYKMDINLVESPMQRNAHEDLNKRAVDVRQHVMTQLTGKTTE